MADLTFAKTSDRSVRAMSYAIRDLLSGGLASDDNLIPLRLIDRTVMDIYATILKQDDFIREQKGERLETWRETPFKCIKLEDNHDFDCGCTKKGGAFKKAVIPKMTYMKGQPYLPYVGNTKLSIGFIPFNSISDINANLPFLTKPGYFMVGETNLYVALPMKFALVCDLTVIGIPENPMATITGRCFDIWSQEWRISEPLRSVVMQQALQFLGNPLSVTAQTRDERNNAAPGNTFATIQT